MVEHSKKNANIDTSGASQAVFNLRVPFVGNLKQDLPVVTQSLLQSKDLITKNTMQANESLDSLATCVCVGKKKQRIGVRLTIAERAALENAAKQKNMTLSNLISQFAQNFTQQKTA